LQTVTDLGYFSRREVNALSLDLSALLLVVRALLLAVRALAKRPELVRHLLDRPSEIGELGSDGRYVLLGCHVGPDSMVQESS
jgi:hypothetical protein